MTAAETPAKPAAKPAAKTAAKKSPAKPVVKPAAAKAAVAQPAPAAVVETTVVETTVVETAPVVETVAVVAEPIATLAAATPAAAAPAAAPAVVAAVAAVPSLDLIGDKALKSYEEASAVAKDALDAVVASSEVLTQGLQYLGDTVYGLTQQSIDDGIEAGKQILAAKTFRELVDLQSSLAKTQLDRLLAEAPRLGDLSVKLVEDTVAPLSASLNAAVDKMVKSAAA